MPQSPRSLEWSCSLLDLNGPKAGSLTSDLRKGSSESLLLCEHCFALLMECGNPTVVQSVIKSKGLYCLCPGLTGPAGSAGNSLSCTQMARSLWWKSLMHTYTVLYIQIHLLKSNILTLPGHYTQFFEYPKYQFSLFVLLTKMPQVDIQASLCCQSLSSTVQFVRQSHNFNYVEKWPNF